MKTRLQHASTGWILAALLLSGCPGKDPPRDTGTTDVVSTDTGTTDTGTTDTGTPDTGTPDADTPDTGTLDTGTSDTSVDAFADVIIAPSCSPDAGTGEAGCIICPQTSSEFLNRCVNNSCVPFDRARLRGLNSDGGLPPLP